VSALPTVSRTAIGVARLRAAEQRRWRSGLAFHISIRTRFFDDYLREALGSGIRQVVVLGAGLDARAFRLAVPRDVHWFELDLPDVLAFKQAVLDRQAATAWLAEGLLIYLDHTTASRVLRTMTALSGAGSRFAAERGDLAARVAAAGERPDDAAALWLGGPAGGVAAWLKEHRWQTTTYDVTDVATSYRREAPASARSGFVVAAR
jgi:O-methyltransferase involved in polyketide biosynthesis